jgi:hypothetical protein
MEYLTGERLRRQARDAGNRPSQERAEVTLPRRRARALN